MVAARFLEKVGSRVLAGRADRHRCREWADQAHGPRVSHIVLQRAGGARRRADGLLTQRRRAPMLRQGQRQGDDMISVLIGVLIIVVVGAICFWAIDKFATDGRLANLLKLLVVLICLGAILQRVLPLTY